MVGAMLRHMMSLRTLKRDHGWIHTLLEEAENERMHLLTFLKLREPGSRFVLPSSGAQGVFFNAFFLSYLISPRTCHRFVGSRKKSRAHVHARVTRHRRRRTGERVGDATRAENSPRDIGACPKTPRCAI